MSETGSVPASILDKVIASYEEALRETRAKRDQARQQLSALGLMARSFADVVEERDQARQALADAPHGKDCASIYEHSYPCNCWKAGL